MAERQAKTAQDCLSQRGYSAVIEVVNDQSNLFQKGSSIVLWAETDTGVIIGADAIGQLRKMAEAVGKEAAEKLIAELSAQPTVDVYLADMLIPYMALAEGKSAFLARTISEHIEVEHLADGKNVKRQIHHSKSKQPLQDRKKQLITCPNQPFA